MQQPLRKFRFHALSIGRRILLTTLILAQIFPMLPTKSWAWDPIAPEDALAIIEKHQTTQMSELFPEVNQPLPKSRGFTETPLNPENCAEFAKIFDSLTTALNGTGYLNKNEYMKWWNQNKGRFLTRDFMTNWKDRTIAEFIATTWAEATISLASEKQDKGIIYRNLIQPMNNPRLKAVCGTLLAISGGVGLYVLGILQGAIVAGPFAGIVGAALESVVRLGREKVGVIGARKLKKLAYWIEGVPTHQKELVDEATKAKAALADLNDKTRKFDFSGMTREQAVANWAELKSKWVKINQGWIESLPPYMRDGRGFALDADFFRPINFASQMDIFETRRKDEFAIFQKLKSELPQAISQNDLERAITLQRRLFSNGSPADQKAFEALKRSISRQIAEIDKSKVRTFLKMLDAIKKVEIQKEKIAATAAHWVITDFVFPEWYRNLPDGQLDFSKVSKYLGKESYIRQVRPKLQQLFDDMKFQIDVKVGTLDGIAQAASHFSDLSPGKVEASIKASAEIASIPTGKPGCLKRALRSIRKQ